jgi:F-type H+-transporting ATPase subunit delta
MAAVLGDPEIMFLLESPKIHFEEKVKIIKQCVPEVSELALNLAYLLVVKRRLGLLREIALHYEQLVDFHEGIEHAEVITAVPIDEKMKEKFHQKLTSIVGMKVKLATSVDPNLIGGFVARIGDQLIDGSVHTKLFNLRKNLAEVG